MRVLHFVRGYPAGGKFRFSEAIESFYTKEGHVVLRTINAALYFVICCSAAYNREFVNFTV